MSIPEQEQQQPQQTRHHSSISRTKTLALSAGYTVVHHLKKHVGMGIICSVAYFDPGNWSVDLQAGSNFGYRPMLFVVLIAGFGAIVVQTLTTKLGCVTGLDLASHCRLLLHDHPRHPHLVRRCVLYPLYVLSEIAIIATDLAELLGSAIGLCLIFPTLPLWAGVVITAADVLIFLFFSDPSRGQGRPVRAFELTVIGMVFGVFACFVVLLVKASPDWDDVFMGYIPSKGLFQAQPDAVYAAISILGATVMPHALFLGSSLAAQDRISLAPEVLPSLPGPGESRPRLWQRSKRYIVSLFTISRAERVAASKDYRTKYGDRENNSLSFIRQHLMHGIVDVVSSLVVFAIPINSAILTLAASVFFKSGSVRNAPAGLFDAHDIIKERLGSGAALIFALALICAGQTSSVTVTLAGQIVSEGFIEWRISPFMRRLLTRSLSLIPSMVVAVSVGRKGINSLLIASQVLLSIVLPFVLFPLIYLTCSEVVMRVRATPHAIIETEVEMRSVVDEERKPSLELPMSPLAITEKSLDSETKVIKLVSEETVDFSNGRSLTLLSYAIWCVVLAANFYAIIVLFMK